MNAYRIQIKFYLEIGEDVAPETWFRVFNTWIPETTDEVLVDVADYSHVHRGTVTLLVGHEANYSIDGTDGKAGLLYDRKQPSEGSFAHRLESAFVSTLKACGKLERDSLLAGAARFRTNEVLIGLNDRLLAPNSEETHAAVRVELDRVLDRLFNGADVTIERDPDPKQRFTLRVDSASEESVADLLRRLNGNC
ncbi:MAG: hypothetical protein OXR72_17685 [Gemmatimonadota bacterium]|nr:hypothetical protein [Gemmatimonadota bacterium]